MEPEQAENDWISFCRKYKFSKESGLGQLDDGTLIAVDAKSREVKFSTLKANHSSLLPAFVSTPEHVLHKGYDMNLDEFIRKLCTPPTFVYVLSYDAKGKPSKTYKTTKLEVREAIQDMFRILMYAHQEKEVCFNGFSTENLVFIDGKLNMWKLKRFELSEPGREKDMKSAYNILLKIFGTKDKAPQDITGLFEVVEKYPTKKTAEKATWEELELLMATHLGVMNTRDRLTYFKELNDQRIPTTDKNVVQTLQYRVSGEVKGEKNKYKDEYWGDIFNSDKKDFKATPEMVACFKNKSYTQGPDGGQITIAPTGGYGTSNDSESYRNVNLIRCMRNFAVHLKDHVPKEFKADNEYLEISLMYLFGKYGIQFQESITDLHLWKLFYESIYEKVKSNEKRHHQQQAVVFKEPLPVSKIKPADFWANRRAEDQTSSSRLSADSVAGDPSEWTSVTTRKGRKGKK